MLPEFCNEETQHWIFEATVYKTNICRGFKGFGDADPSNLSTLVRGAELRVAETRAVNRALRKAYGIGICSLEELASSSATTPPCTRKSPSRAAEATAGREAHNQNGTRLRDRLCQLIRQYALDPQLVKAYATAFCGTKTLRDATRDRVEMFVRHLADRAEKDRNALVCELNNYVRPESGAA